MRTVVGAVIVREGKVLIGQRKRGSSMGLKWEFPGGKLEPGETPESCLKRELLEELGVVAEIGRFYGSGRSTADSADGIELLTYEAAYTPDQLITLSDHEEVRWVPLKELGAYDFPDADRPIVEKLMGSSPEGEVDTESQSFGHRGGDEEPTLPPGGQARGRTPTCFTEHVQASFSAHGAREGVAPRAYARGGGDASPGNCGDNEEGRMKATRYDTEMNRWPINQAARRMLAEAGEHPDPAGLYMIQLAHWAVRTGKTEPGHDVAETVNAMTTWRPERIHNFLMLPDSDAVYAPEGWAEAASPLALAAVILDDIEEKMVRHFPWYRSF